MDFGPPPLTMVATSIAQRAPQPAVVTALVDDLVAALGPAQISTVEAARRAASTDFAHVSPVLPPLLPTRLADVVAFPRTPEEIIAVVRLAHRHQVALTPRGAGTGSYGQAVPLAGGIVVDLTRCDQVLAVGDGWIKAQAGVTFVELEAAARASGQEIAMLPTTVGSTLGGFLGGGAGGVGSIEHGWLWDDFVLSLDVVTCPPGAEPVAVHGEDCRPYLHAYGVTGIIATATVRLAPAVPRVAVLASFSTLESAAAAGHALLRLDPAPRLVSIDEPGLVATYPADPAMPEGCVSLRAVLAIDHTDTMATTVAAHGGQIEAVRPKGAGYVSTLAFNHVTLRARRARPDLCHLQVAGDALVTGIDEIRDIIPGALLHLDGLRGFLDPSDPRRGRSFGGLLFFPYQNPKKLYEDVACLRQLGVIVVDPHTWLLGGPALPAMRAAAVANDPQSLLNPGRLPPS